jgi:hypothetical protein
VLDSIVLNETDIATFTVAPPEPNEALIDLTSEVDYEAEYYKDMIAVEELREPEVLQAIETPVVIKRTIDSKKAIDSFIDNLFEVSGKMRDKTIVSKEVGLTLIHAIKIVDFLTHNGVYIQYRPTLGWYRLASIEEIKKAMGTLYAN